MPGPYRAAVGKPHAVRKRPRRGQDPSLRTAPSAGAGPYSAYVNYIRRAGCPHPAASSRGGPSTGSHPRRGRRPRRPGNLPSPPIPGKTPGPGMPGPYRAAASKPPAVRKRPRRGQDPSLRTYPSTSARPYSAYVNYIRRAGCPHPAASSRGSPSAGKPHAVHKRPRRGQDPSLRTDPSTSARTLPQVRAATRQRAATHVGGGVPDAPETSCCRPSPGKPPGWACPAPTARRWASPMPSINAHGGAKTPPYEPTHQRVPAPRRKFARQPVNGQPPT